jgi:hypothetical protein
LSQRERYEFAFRILSEQGERTGDYLFAALRQATSCDVSPATLELIERWLVMAKLVEEIHGSPVTLTYRACDRIKAEKRGRR